MIVPGVILLSAFFRGSTSRSPSALRLFRLASPLSFSASSRGFPIGFPAARPHVSSRTGADQIRPFFSETDQIGPSRFHKRFFHKLIICRIPILDQRSLHCLLMRIFRHIDRLHRPWIQSRIVHTCGQCGRRRIKILHLLQHLAPHICRTPPAPPTSFRWRPDTEDIRYSTKLLFPGFLCTSKMRFANCV